MKKLKLAYFRKTLLTYKGGKSQLSKIIADNVKYLEYGSNNSAQAKVFVLFFLGKDGYIESDMKVHCKLDTSHLKANALSGDDEEKATSLFEDRQSAPLAC